MTISSPALKKNHDPDSAIPWRFSSFCTEGSRGDQRITIYFAQPPQPAAYITEVSDLLYDTRCRLAVNYDHPQRQHRPHALNYLRDVCNRYPKALAIIDKAAKCRFGTAAYNRHMGSGRILRNPGQRPAQRTHPQRF